ncbi:MAG: hypothetical protein AAGA54_13105 [Myxococcota bacterium]
MPVTLTTLALSGFATTVMPYARTDASALNPPGWDHHEVVRLGRDFGDRSHEVVVDAWSPERAPDSIADLRFWWVNTEKADQRSPFGSKLRKHVGLRFVPNAPGDWTVHLRGDRKEFVFDVELDDDGVAAAFGDVQTEDGVVEHCRATQGTFIARRLLGVPIGLKELQVTCVDPVGQTIEGTLPYRPLKRGRTWTGR